VVKVGGGLLRDEGLEGLRRACTEATEIAAHRPVLVVPGGGPFADAVRAVDEQVGLDDATAHALALRAMDQLGVLLRRLLAAAEPLAELVAPRGLALLQAARQAQPVEQRRRLRLGADLYADSSWCGLQTRA